MKRKLVTLFLALAMLFGVTGLVACGKDENKQSSSTESSSSTELTEEDIVQSLSGTEIWVKDFVYNDQEKAYYLLLPNSEDAFDFTNKILVAKDSSYLVALDIYGQQTVETKTVALAEGDNVQYVLVANSLNNIEAYKFIIRRNVTYNVVFNTSGGSEVESQKVEEGSTATAPAAPTKTGYTFVKWAYDFTQPITSSITILAEWRANTYSLHFSVEGMEAPASQTITYEQPYGTLPLLTKTGYIFLGWFTELNGETQVVDTTVLRTPAEQTVYAKWTTDVIYTLNETSTEYFVTGCNDKEEVVIFDEYKGLPVTKIADSAFKEKSVKSVHIGQNITAIGAAAFHSCRNLTNVTIPNSVAEIGAHAFHSCSNLKNITLPSKISKIEEFTFMECSSLTSVIIPDRVLSIGDWAFCACSELKDVTFGENTRLSSIGARAFQGCSSLTSVIIPETVNAISAYAFGYCGSLTSVTFENPIGWRAGEGNGTSFSANNLSISSTAATYLTNTYAGYRWTRTTE